MEQAARSPTAGALAGVLVPHRCQRACRCWYMEVDAGKRIIRQAAAQARAGNRRKGCLVLGVLALAALLVPALSLLA